MGASVAVVIALIFSAFLIIGTIIYSAVDYSNSLVRKAQYDQDTMKKAKMQTDITITNISNSILPSRLNVTLKNTGKTTLNASLLDVFVDGNYYAYNLTPAGNNTWTPERTMNITIYPVSNSTGQRIKVITENGISDYMVYV